MERLLTLYSEVQSTDVRWLWYPFIAIGKITLLQGDPGDGKSSIQIVMEEAEFVESIRQAQQEPYRVRRIKRQIRQLTAEKAHTQGIKEKLYGDYADEILTREDFLNYNELYSKRIEEYDRKITELEAEQRNLQTAPNAYPFLDVYRKYRKLEEITRPMIVELIEKIEVYEGNRVEITFRFQDEIADLLEELHQKQMGQHEVSA